MKAWLKEGILIFPFLIAILLLISLATIIINKGSCPYYPQTCPMCVGCVCETEYSLEACFKSISLFGLPASLLYYFWIDSYLAYLLFTLLSWFILGALIGWIIGKIKYKK